ncbi:MAG: iron ABC transporter permease [Coriobacteriia bacterium]|nr:iron ABC transporter permease [Coriobacteriia bacterium]
MKVPGRNSKQEAAALEREAAGVSVVPQGIRHDQAAFRRKTVALVVVLLVVYALSLCISVTTYQVYSPGEAVAALVTWVQTSFATMFQGAHYTTVDLTDLCPNYFQVLDRAGISVMAILCGIVLTTSGMIYQNVFRNPVAAPTMLGVAGGLNMGLLIFVGVYGSMALYATTAHYLFAYLGGFFALILVLALSRLINGKRWFSVVDMLLVGSIVSQVFGQIVLYVTYYVFDDETFLIYTTINEVLQVNTEPVAYAFLIVGFLVTFIPVFLIRFRLNALSFTETEARGMGVDLNRFRYVMLFLATIMVIVAMAHAGMVGMAALIVPFLSRAFFGAESRKQLVGNILIGAILVLVCRDIAALLSIVLWKAGFLFDFPIGVVASLVCLPFFVWIVARQQRTWE